MLTVSNLHHSIARTPILCDLSFTLQAGEVVGFVGDNGSGKTTTLSIISGCQRPSAGTVTFENQSIFDNLAHYQVQMGYLPDSLPLYPNATVLQNLTYAAKLKEVPSPQERVHEMLNRFNLQQISPVKVRTLSKGWTQWVGIAQAWVSKPRLLLLDEPTSGLDPSGRQRFCYWLEEIRQQGHTVFFSSHILGEVESVCDRILWLDNGRLIEKDHTDTHRMRCIIANLDNINRLGETLQQCEGVLLVRQHPQGLDVTCTPEARTMVAQTVAHYGLLEFRKLS